MISFHVCRDHEWTEVKTTDDYSVWECTLCNCLTVDVREGYKGPITYEKTVVIPFED